MRKDAPLHQLSVNMIHHSTAGDFPSSLIFVYLSSAPLSMLRTISTSVPSYNSLLLTVALNRSPLKPFTLIAFSFAFQLLLHRIVILFFFFFWKKGKLFRS